MICPPNDKIMLKNDYKKELERFIFKLKPNYDLLKGLSGHEKEVEKKKIDDYI